MKNAERYQETVYSPVERASKDLRRVLNDIKAAARLTCRWAIKIDDKPMQEAADHLAVEVLRVANAAVTAGARPLNVLAMIGLR